MRIARVRTSVRDIRAEMMHTCIWRQKSTHFKDTLRLCMFYLRHTTQLVHANFVHCSTLEIIFIYSKVLNANLTLMVYVNIRGFKNFWWNSHVYLNIRV